MGFGLGFDFLVDSGFDSGKDSDFDSGTDSGSDSDFDSGTGSVRRVYFDSDLRVGWGCLGCWSRAESTFDLSSDSSCQGNQYFVKVLWKWKTKLQSLSWAFFWKRTKIKSKIKSRMFGKGNLRVW